MAYSAQWTRGMRQVLQRARTRAAGPVITPSDLLAALAESTEPEVRDELQAVGVAFEPVQVASEAVGAAGDEAAVPKGREASPRLGRAARAVLQGAVQEGHRENAETLGPRHLLSGLLQSEGEAAARLRREGLTLERLRAEPVSSASSSRRGDALVGIDEGSRLSIHEQVVGQIREAVATGRLMPGDRLPTVRQLAATLDIAPGTVARSYRELERLGVVVTEGARGTRVAAPGRSFTDAASRERALAGLLRDPVVAAYHMGADATEIRAALMEAMSDIYGDAAMG